MGVLYYTSVFFHLLFATLWIGGMLFLPLVLLPAIKKHPDKIKLILATGLKFRTLGWVVLIGLAITGTANLYLRGFSLTMEFFTDTEYGQILTYKLILFSLILLISGIHDFMIGAKAIEEMEKGMSRLKHVARWSGRINLLLALAVAFFGLVLARGGVW